MEDHFDREEMKKLAEIVLRGQSADKTRSADSSRRLILMLSLVIIVALGLWLIFFHPFGDQTRSLIPNETGKSSVSNKQQKNGKSAASTEKASTEKLQRKKILGKTISFYKALNGRDVDMLRKIFDKKIIRYNEHYNITSEELIKEFFRYWKKVKSESDSIVVNTFSSRKGDNGLIYASFESEYSFQMVSGATGGSKRVNTIWFTEDMKIVKFISNKK